MHVVAAIVLAACTNSNNSAGTAPPPNLMEQIRAVDLSPRATLRTSSNQRTGSGSELRAATYLGDNTAQAQAQAQAQAPSGDQQASDPAVTGALGDRAQPRVAEQG